MANTGGLVDEFESAVALVKAGLRDEYDHLVAALGVRPFGYWQGDKWATLDHYLQMAYGPGAGQRLGQMVEQRAGTVGRWRAWCEMVRSCVQMEQRLADAGWWEAVQFALGEQRQREALRQQAKAERYLDGEPFVVSTAVPAWALGMMG